jgi:hypothetical protein
VIQNSLCPTTPSCISAIQSRVHDTAQFLYVDPTVNCQNNQPPSGKTSCVSIFNSSTAPSACPLDNNAPNDSFYCVVVAYDVQTLMPISGAIPFLGTINYPGFMVVVGQSKMRAE